MSREADAALYRFLRELDPKRDAAVVNAARATLLGGSPITKLTNAAHHTPTEDFPVQKRVLGTTSKAGALYHKNSTKRGFFKKDVVGEELFCHSFHTTHSARSMATDEDKTASATAIQATTTGSAPNALISRRKRSKAALEIERLTRKVSKLERLQSAAQPRAVQPPQLPMLWNMISICVYSTRIKCENGKMLAVDRMWRTLDKPVLWNNTLWLGEARNFVYIQRLLKMSGTMQTVLCWLNASRKDVPSMWAHDSEQARFLEKVVVVEQTSIPLCFSAPVLVHCGKNIIAAAWPAFLVSSEMLEIAWTAAHGDTDNKPWWWQHRNIRRGVLLFVNPVPQANLPRFLMTTGAEGVPSVLGVEFTSQNSLQRFLQKASS